MSNVIDLDARREKGEPEDDVVLCTLSINGRGDVGLFIDDYIETKEQHNWLIAKIAAAMAEIVDRKNAMQA